jgi:hypothetical protein
MKTNKKFLKDEFKAMYVGLQESSPRQETSLLVSQNLGLGVQGPTHLCGDETPYAVYCTAVNTT